MSGGGQEVIRKEKKTVRNKKKRENKVQDWGKKIWQGKGERKDGRWKEVIIPWKTCMGGNKGKEN